MEVISPTVITLSSDERDVLIELLARERTNLPVEIHHTRTGKFRELLKSRLDLIEALFERLNAS